ncbi:hypothetical protein BKA56DRAFT_107344 [Ilyonectria sp. MPI-CAGE-AT-0026]|nr:hypothetical protein BKA56DRAFT_107344 [Ilyonectria sp. MPI-CAGE-AT-0026]
MTTLTWQKNLADFQCAIKTRAKEGVHKGGCAHVAIAHGRALELKTPGVASVSVAFTRSKPWQFCCYRTVITKSASSSNQHAAQQFIFRGPSQTAHYPFHQFTVRENNMDNITTPFNNAARDTTREPTKDAPIATRAQPWKQAWAAINTKDEGGKSPNMALPWVNWKPDPNKPDEKPWISWMNDDKFNPGSEKTQLSVQEVDELRGRPFAYPTRKRTGSAAATTTAEGG